MLVVEFVILKIFVVGHFGGSVVEVVAALTLGSAWVVAECCGRIDDRRSSPGVDNGTLVGVARWVRRAVVAGVEFD
jgi:hypothetical protein